MQTTPIAPASGERRPRLKEVAAPDAAARYRLSEFKLALNSKVE